MGGRGAKSGGLTSGGAGASGGGAPQPRTLQSVASDLKSKYGVTVGIQNMSQIDQTVAMAALDSVDAILTDFPQAVGVMKKITAHDNLKAGEYAHATYFGEVVFNKKYFADLNKLSSHYAGDVSSGFHPRGTDYKGIADHEIGHILERSLIQKAIKNGDISAWEGGPAWAKSTFSSKIIHEAVSNLKQASPGKGLLTNSLISKISRYATKNRSEALAECVADYRSNGSNANPLSVEVWNILKRELG